MGKTGSPRHGSMQFWPRKRASREHAKIRSFPVISEVQSVGFAGYKVGMTHLTFTDNRKNSITKGDAVTWPVTIIEVPPMQIIGARFYKKSYNQTVVGAEVKLAKISKDLARTITIPKKISTKIEDVKPEEYIDARLVLATQPSLTGIGKKKPEIFEMAIGGNMGEKYNYIKENLGKTIEAKDIFKEGDLIDSHGVTKGKGFQGAVKRFGVQIRSHKSEKSIRGSGSLGPWKGQAHIMYRVPAPGKMGFHLRTEYNKILLKISENPEEVNANGGFLRYGLVKNPCLLIKGSIQGSTKRLITFNKAIRPNKKLTFGEVPSIEFISTASKQGR
jgi:large subunit ribosomal protein L3